MTTSNCSCHLFSDNNVSSIISNPFIQETVWGGGASTPGVIILQHCQISCKSCAEWNELKRRPGLRSSGLSSTPLQFLRKPLIVMLMPPPFIHRLPHLLRSPLSVALRLLKHSSPKATHFSGRLPSSPSASHDTSQTANPHNPFLCVMVTAAQQWSSWMRSCGPSLV